MGVAGPKASLLACCTTAMGSLGCRCTSRTPGSAAAGLLECPWAAPHRPCKQPDKPSQSPDYLHVALSPIRCKLWV